MKEIEKKDAILIDSRDDICSDYVLISWIRDYKEKRQEKEEKHGQIIYCIDGYIVKRIIDNLLKKVGNKLKYDEYLDTGSCIQEEQTLVPCNYIISLVRETIKVVDRMIEMEEKEYESEFEEKQLQSETDGMDEESEYEDNYQIETSDKYIVQQDLKMDTRLKRAYEKQREKHEEAIKVGHFYIFLCDDAELLYDIIYQYLCQQNLFWGWHRLFKDQNRRKVVVIVQEIGSLVNQFFRDFEGIRKLDWQEVCNGERRCKFGDI